MRSFVPLLVLLAACSQPTTAADGADAGGDAGDSFDVQFAADAKVDGDAGKDALTDAVADAVPDAVKDAVVDALLDVVDVIVDVVADVAPDVAKSDVPAVDVAPDVADDAAPDAAQEVADDVPADDVAADVPADDVPVLNKKAGCADGTREGFADQQIFPTIAACGGAWDQPGIFNMPAKCSNQAGNDGLNAAGVGCTVTDLCAVGWHVCYGKDDVVFRNPDGCAGVMTGATPPVFFTTQMSSTGAFNCASGTAATNDLFGCGNLGCDFTGNATCKQLCSPLTLSSHDLCKGLRNDKGCGDWCNHLGKYPGAPNSWDCGNDGDKEALNVVKSHPEQQGGVLCCLD